eukprot:8978457-Alexandrium_andersonii.AAC.1
MGPSPHQRVRAGPTKSDHHRGREYGKRARRKEAGPGAPTRKPRQRATRSAGLAEAKSGRRHLPALRLLAG